MSLSHAIDSVESQGVNRFPPPDNCMFPRRDLTTIATIATSLKVIELSTLDTIAQKPKIFISHSRFEACLPLMSYLTWMPIPADAINYRANKVSLIVMWFI